MKKVYINSLSVAERQARQEKLDFMTRYMVHSDGSVSAHPYVPLCGVDFENDMYFLEDDETTKKFKTRYDKVT